MNVEISIVVPVYNVERYLYRCMQSILCQKIDNFEVILIDDGSTDESPKICDEYREKYTFVKVLHKRNEGLGLARNDGISMADGKYIAFVDSDDSIAPDYFSDLLKTAYKNNADVCLSGMTDIYKDRKIESVHLFAGRNFQESEIANVLLPSIIGYDKYGKNYAGMSVCRGIYKKEIFDIYNVRFYSEKEYISEDVIFNIQFMNYCKCVSVINGAGYYYHHNTGTLTTKYNPSRFFCIKRLFLYEKKLVKGMKNYEELWNRMASMFLANLRVTIMQEMEAKEWNFDYDKMRINEIICDECVQDVIEKYDFSKMPIKQKMFCEAIKQRNVLLIEMMAIFQNKWNRKKLLN